MLLIISKKMKNSTKNLSLSKIYIFMDNAPIHYKRDERAYYVDEKINIVYNVPYCCHLNPIEYCFSRLKKYLKSRIIKNQDNLIDITVEFLESNSEEIIVSEMKYSLRIWENLLLDE